MRSEGHVKRIECLTVIFLRIKRTSAASLFAFKGIIEGLEASVGRCGEGRKDSRRRMDAFVRCRGKRKRG